MKIEWTEEMLERAYRLNNKAKAAIELEAIIFTLGLDKYYYPESLLGSLSKAICSIEKEDLPKAIKKLKKAIPDAVNKGVSMWSPYGEKVIIEHEFKSQTYDNISIALWIETDIHSIPQEYQSEKCKFVETIRNSYQLVCETDQ